MKVCMQATISGTRNGTDWPPAGGIVDLPDVEAADIIAAGLAEAVGAVEAATVPKSETATVSTEPGKRRRRG